MDKYKKLKARNSSYWQKRMENVLVENEQTALKYEQKLLKIYNEYKLIVEQQLQAFYQKYAEETGLSLVDAKKRLNPKQLKSFHQQQKIYIDKVEELIIKNRLDIKPEYGKFPTRKYDSPCIYGNIDKISIIKQGEIRNDIKKDC